MVDENYTGVRIELSPEHRDLAERIVMGEAGGEGFEETSFSGSSNTRCNDNIWI